VGTILDDLSDSLLQDYKNTAKIESVAHIDHNIKKLMADRLDIIVYEERSWQKKLAKHNLSSDFFETLYILHDASPYYAFHKDTPKGLVQKFQQALDHIKTTPKFQELLDKYLD
jgi:polar amino acid transport system substrate-binding protein